MKVLQMNPLRASFARGHRADAALAALVVLIVGVMIVPLPTFLLDILLASNVSIAVLLLLVAMYVSGGLALASFPTLLLVTTLYRLSLNVSSTRLILLQADAGRVIEAFGSFVVRGDYAVGAVIFLILTLIQFIVIAKGAERVAEVGARFTLDAMPGKQMSIDSDLRSGALNQEQARERRRTLQRESQFYGAMDGAMKFVKGDAIAGIVITCINILAGLAIGVLKRDMSVAKALKTYGLLTIGDGLLSQIPALLISSAAGLVVTRVAAEDEKSSLGNEVARQVFGDPRALGMAAFFLLSIALLPGLPTLPFLVLALAFALLAWKRQPQTHALQGASAEPAARGEVGFEGLPAKALGPRLLPLALRCGTSLIARSKLGSLHLWREMHWPELRARLFHELGLSLPALAIQHDPQLEAEAFVFYVNEIPVLRGESEGEILRVFASEEELREAGVDDSRPCTDPLRPQAECRLVTAREEERLRAAGLSLENEEAFFTRLLHRVARRHAASLFGIQETQNLLDQLEAHAPALVRQLLPRPLSLQLLFEVLRRLLEEEISIRPLKEILETLGSHAAHEKDPLRLAELVRAAMRQQISHAFAQEGVLTVHLLDPAIEESIREALQHTATGSYLALPPDMAKSIVDAIREHIHLDEEGVATLLTQVDVRRFVRRLIESDLPNVRVLSFQELDPSIHVQPLGHIQL